MTKKVSGLKIIPLGGLNEIGKNMTVYQYEDDMIVVDCGMTFPDDEMLGIDIVIPDITFLKKNADKVRGIVYTHGHEDHIGATPYVLSQLKMPLYGTKLTLGLIEHKLKEHKNVGAVQSTVVKAGQTIKLGAFEIEFIAVGHSIPDSVSLCISTPVGKVIHTGDFKVDYSPIDGQRIDLNRFAELGNEGVLALLADSTNVERKGYTMSESSVGETFDELFHHAQGRIIVASFASNIHRVQQIINAAVLNNRKVALVGRSMVNVSEVALTLGYLKYDETVMIDIRDLDRYPDNEIVVITTGSQGEPMAGLSRMASGEHKNVVIRSGDMVVFSSTPIPGNEKSVTRIINLLYERGAEVIYDSLADVHVSGHACQEELKLMHALTKPKFFVPLHGEYTHLRKHAELAEQMGLNQSNIFIMKTGEVLELNTTVGKMLKNVPSGNVLIDGLGIGDVGNIVLRDRKHLAEDGLMVVVIALNKETGQIVSGPDIISRGFVYVRESEELMNGAKDKINSIVKRCLANNVRDWSGLKSSIRDGLKEHLYVSTKRSPMILPIIIEV
jgi:ribonuclease J